MEKVTMGIASMALEMAAEKSQWCVSLLASRRPIAREIPARDVDHGFLISDLSTQSP
jgi:hypothetical protein